MLVFQMAHTLNLACREDLRRELNTLSARKRCSPIDIVVIFNTTEGTIIFSHKQFYGTLRLKMTKKRPIMATNYKYLFPRYCKIMIECILDTQDDMWQLTGLFCPINVGLCVQNPIKRLKECVLNKTKLQ